ncbi:MAG: dihydropteroate synthase [Cytophagales bacterium]|nr:dihydropteroate synthase [Cytophagales bacterium]
MKSINVKDKLIDLSIPKIMGIVNVTPDSFFDESRSLDFDRIKSRIVRMIEEEVDILDIGGYSTRPGAKEVEINEEIDRVVPVIEWISNEFPEVITSVDTFRSEVAKKAINAGAGIINDVSGGNLDKEMFATVSALKVPYILMHMRGTPQSMQSLTVYENLTEQVIQELQSKLKILNEMALSDIIVDPGFGFAKTMEQNYKLFKDLDQFKIFNRPLLVGISRKSMINTYLEIEAKDALNATTILNTVALMKGADILRVHDVKEAVEVRKLLTNNIL